MLGSIEEDVFGVWQINWQVFSVFWRIKHQWNMVSTLHGFFYQGLRYAELAFVLDAMGLQNSQELFDDLQLMEFSAKAVLNQS